MMLRFEKLVRVAGFMNAFEAHLAAQHLHNHGVPALVSDDSTAFSHLRTMFMTQLSNVEVRVRPQDFEEARRILDAVEEWPDEDLIEADEDACEPDESEEPETDEAAAVCQDCGGADWVWRKRWWPILAILFVGIALGQFRPLTATAIGVVLLGVFLMLPPKRVCTRCGAVNKR